MGSAPVGSTRIFPFEPVLLTEITSFLGLVFLFFFFKKNTAHLICLKCLERAFLSEETAVNRYNAAALIVEQSATRDLTPEEEREVERLFEEVAGICSQQRENGTLRCVIRSYNRMITYLLKTSHSAFPDLRFVSLSYH